MFETLQAMPGRRPAAAARPRLSSAESFASEWLRASPCRLLSLR